MICRRRSALATSGPASGPAPMPAAAAQRHLAAATSTKSLPKSPQRERLYRSSSQAGAAGLDLPLPSGGVAGLRRGSHCPLGRAASSDVPRRGSFNRGGSKRHHRKGSSSKEIPLMRIRQAPQSHLRSRTLGVSQECVGHVWNRLDRLPVFSDTPCAHTSFEYGGDPLLDNAQGEGRKHSFPCFHYRRMGARQEVGC